MDSDKRGIAVTARYYLRRYLMLAFGMFMLGVIGGAALALNGHDLRALAPSDEARHHSYMMTQSNSGTHLFVTCKHHAHDQCAGARNKQRRR